MKFLFPYMARWKAINWSRYQHIFTILAQQGHEVFVLQPPPANINETNYQEIEVSLPAGLHLIDVPVNKNIWNRDFPANKLFKKGYVSLASVPVARELIRRHAIDVLVVYNIPQYPLLNIKNCIKIFDFADDYLEMLRHELGRFDNPVATHVAGFFLNKMIERCDLTLTVAHTLAQSIAAKTNATIVPNGVDLRAFSPGGGIEIRRRFKTPIVGFIGSFEYFIDFDVILDAASQLREFTFLLVGAGRDFSRVENKIAEMRLENVVLTGGVPHREVAAYIDAMDICLNVFKKIPVSHGACPIKLFEYWAMKKPVISTRLKEIELIDQGCVFWGDTAVEIVESIRKILNEKKVVTDRVDLGYNLVRDKYNWSAISSGLIDIIKHRF